MFKVLSNNCVLIPDNAKLVFSGQIFDVYHWKQELFDGKKATYEMLKRPDTVQVIAVKDNKIVIVKDEQPNRSALLCLPGGRTEPTDESWKESAKRELLEETGLSFKSWKLVDVQQPAHKIEWFVSIFIATDFESQIEQKLDGGEKIEIKYIDFDELKRSVYSSEDKELNYLRNIFTEIDTLGDLLATNEFTGQEVDRS